MGPISTPPMAPPAPTANRPLLFAKGNHALTADIWERRFIGGSSGPAGGGRVGTAIGDGIADTLGLLRDNTGPKG